MLSVDPTKPVGVWGWVNLEVSVSIGSFPVQYEPARSVDQGIFTSASGIAYNVALALARLGTPVRLTPFVGQDVVGNLLLNQITAEVAVHPVLVPASPQTVVLYDDDGHRELLYDQKGAAHTPYPPSAIESIDKCSLAIVPNDYGCVAVARRAKELGIPIVTDVHEMYDFTDDRNNELCSLADVVFMSDALITEEPGAWLRRVGDKFATSILVLTMGSAGSLISTDGGHTTASVPATLVRPVKSTVGAGDSLLAAFVDGVLKGMDSVDALRRASVYAGYKVGAVGGADGLLTESELQELLVQFGLDTSS